MWRSYASLSALPVNTQARFYVGAPPEVRPDSLVASPQIQKLADHSDVISEVPKCSKIRIFRGSAPGPLSSFHWLQNVWTWNDLEWLFYDKCSLLRTAFQQLGYIYCRVCLHTWPTEICGSGPWSAEYLESAKKLRIFRRRCMHSSSES